MRKTFKILLLAVMLLVMVGMTMMVASAAEGATVEKPYEVLTGESTHGTFATFAEAMAVVKSNGADTIKLLDNVTLTAGITIDTPVTIDGQGTYAITFTDAVKGTSETYADALTVTAAGNVTLNGEDYAFIGQYIIQAVMGDVFLTRDFKEQLLDTIGAGNT